MRHRSSFIVTLWVGLILGISPLLQTTTIVQAKPNSALQMPLGNPDHATSAVSNRQHYLIQRPQYALSFNDSLHYPNWVAWHLEKSDIGDTPRGQFQPDSSLPAGFTKITPSDYTNSGYDRGHNCPSKDRSANKTDNDAVFLMSNMTPQAHGMNAGPWEQLESYSRDLAQAGNELFIYCGHGFTKKNPSTIGKAKVVVPEFGWKIIVVVPGGAGDPLRRITATTRVIAVRMPNINTISRKDWHEYRTSVEDIESVTGLNFFDALPSGIAKALKNRVDFDGSYSKKSSGTTGKATKKDTRETTKPVLGSTNPAHSTDVWVNLKSGAFWRPGTTYYGKTKRGTYMSEADAIKAGYHAAGGQ